MKIPVKTRFALWWRYRNQNHSLFDNPKLITRDGKGVSSILFFLPDSIENVRVAEFFLKSILSQNKPGLSINFLCRWDVRDYFIPIVGASIQTFSKSDLDHWGLPLREFSDHVLKLRFDAIVDLNSNFNPIYAYLAQISGSPFRIGFQSDLADRYYNVIIDLQGTNFLEKGYVNIQKLLDL